MRSLSYGRTGNYVRTWTDEQVETLKRLWEEGQTSTMIAETVGKTRNSVMGQISRLGLHRYRPASPTTKKRKRKSPRDQPPPVWARGQMITRPAVELPVVEEAPVSKEVALLDLENHHCRWPTSGEKAETRFCGHRNALNSPFCEWHTGK